MKKSLFLSTALLALWPAAHAVEYVDWVDWDLIEHWAGDPDGEHKCALVIDFQDGQSNEAYVWGYRWNGTKTGEDLMRAVASQSSILTAMIQYTGNMGSTLNGLGISAAREELDYLHYDFYTAAIAGEVSFGYFEPNITMGQEVAPGYDAEQMCIDAIERARTSGIIEHPLNAFLYGYPAYDYDYWKLDDDYAGSYEFRWQSGWYDGYWSYWHGPNDYDYLGYSGLGMSSSVLVDGGIQAWKYVTFNGGGYGDTGGELAYDLNYDMADWGEEMHDAPLAEQPVDQNNINFWVGTGEKAATVIFQFNDGKGPENLVYGYRWTGGWDDNLMTVIENIAKADPRMSFTKNGANISIIYDADHDGILGPKDHTDTADTWHCYVKRTIDSDFNLVNSARWLNPNAVFIFSHQPEDVTSVELPYQLFRPALDSDLILTVPSVIDYALADDCLKLPVFIQVPEGGKVNTAFNWEKDDTMSGIISSASVVNQMGQITSYKSFMPTSGTVKIRGSYVPAGQTAAQYVYSNEATINLSSPLRPVTSLQFAEADIHARLNHKVDNELTYLPADATYTKINYKSSDTSIASASTTGVTATKKAGNTTITATYDYDPEVTASFDLTTALTDMIADITFEAADENDVITLTPKEMTGLMPIYTPADPDIADVTISLQDNGSAMSNYIATMYKVNLWDKDNNRSTPFELSGHRVGECKLIAEANDGSGLVKTFTVRVVDPERQPAIDYTTGTMMLNEEWFGHTNGGLNWFSPEYDVVYQAYERENPGLSFGCTSQYGIIYDNKLIVSSKQAADGGDPLPGGGRLVVADAGTLKRLGSIDDIKLPEESRSGDGRALCGAGPGRVYFGTHSGIYIIDTDKCDIIGKIKENSDNDSESLYNSQTGDMVLAGNYVFALKQSGGVIIIDINTDKIIKTISDVNVQGITQAADGNVWYATIDENKHSVFVALDYLSLEEINRVEVPEECGTVSCGWGAWRTTQFTGAQSVNSLFFSGGSSISNGGAGDYWRYDIDDDKFAHIASVATLDAHTPGLKQAAYGAIRYDDRSGEIIAGTTEYKASGHYRYNWTHFIDASTGEFNKSVELRPYYWFQSMPIFPDAYAPVMEDIEAMNLDIADDPVKLELNVTDPDNNDANIHLSIVDLPSELDGRSSELPVEVTLSGQSLTIAPKAVGKHTIGIAVESNGRIVTHKIDVVVSDKTTAINDISSQLADIHTCGRSIVVTGYANTGFCLINSLGSVVETFRTDSDRYIHTSAVVPGIYILSGDNGITKKLILK